MFVVQHAPGYVPRVQTTLRATGPLPADEAWERYADLDRWSHWAPQISGVTVTETPGPDARRLVNGLRGTVRAAGLVRLPFEVTAVDEAARTWSWRVGVGPVTLHLDHGVEDARADGDPRLRSRTWLRTTGPAFVVLPYAPLALVALHSLLLER
ncbi:SRPBCC family protein [Actinomycetospora cinnamomea]|uniref:Polyketide cyclase/dehydrase/lipid transport protein n=1 Tax=Actinomycetospora cinnamomea TaxID=663609 RepID=A0A2U1FFM1_9PSEU|nr:SRPBCC family protein [Actinomycetospora cinnamomea]PVZ10959.1 polyketide cyclase/dehydrase/lipid transport protein [Actinomycetospora cinnamomea]